MIYLGGWNKTKIKTDKTTVCVYPLRFGFFNPAVFLKEFWVYWDNFYKKIKYWWKNSLQTGSFFHPFCGVY